MRRLVVPLLIVTLLASAGLVQAEYLEGSRLEADAPAHLRDRTDALVNHGYASVVSPDSARSLDASITARRLEVHHERVTICETGDAACLATVNSREKAVTWTSLTDATVRVTRVLGPYQLVVTNDDVHADTNAFGTPGPIVATVGGRSTLDATRAATHLSPYGHGWSSSGPEAYSTPVYTVPAEKATLSAAGGTLRAVGGFEVLLQGFEVEIKGTDADGDPYSQTYRTSVPREGVAEFLVLEAGFGVLTASSQAPLVAYQVHAADVKGGVDFSRASGTIATESGEQTHEAEDVALVGPIELIVKVVPGSSPPRLDVVLGSDLRVLNDLPLPEEADEGSTTGELVAAGFAGAGGASLLAAAVYYWPRFRYGFTLLALPLYTRIQRTDVLEHGKRDEIYALIRDSPGIHAHEVGARAAIGWGTTVYHLKLLEQHNLIVSKKSGRYKRFFVNTGEYTKTKDVIGALRNDTARAVADYISRHPGCNQKELCAALGIQPSLASWHVQKLEQVKLVRRERDGRQVRYHSGEAWTQAAVALDAAGAPTSTDADADDAARA